MRKAGTKVELLRGRASNDSRRTIWAIADQCAVSGGNFLTSLILIRTLLPVEFGTYALMLNAMMFFNNIQQASVAYPLCVRGARANGRQLRRVLGFALFATGFLLLTLFGPALYVVGTSLHRPTVIVASVCAMLSWQLQDTLRTGFIANVEQRRALTGDIISYGGQAALLGIVSLRTRPSLSIVFWTIAGTSVLALAVQTWQIRPSVPPRRILGPLLQEFLRLGRWSVAAKVIGVLTLQAFPWVILMRHGRVEVAAFQAIFQFLAVTNPLLFSIGSLITVTVAKNGTYRTSSVRNYLLVVTGVAGGYLLMLGAVGPSAMRVLYGAHSAYLGYAPLMRIFAAAWACEMIALLATAILGGLREARSLVIVQIGGAVAAALIALPWIYWKGLTAAGVGMLIVNGARAATGVLLLVRRRSTAVRDSRSTAVEPAELISI